jgi:hypothetical protein
LKEFLGMIADSRSDRSPPDVCRRKAERFEVGEAQATLQPPLPLQLFLPLQPISPVLQPPWPLQLFIPLQSCLFMLESDDCVPELEQPVMVMTLPASNPVMAAEMINVLVVRFIALILYVVAVFCGTEPSKDSRSLGFVAHRRNTLQKNQTIPISAVPLDNEKGRKRVGPWFCSISWFAIFNAVARLIKNEGGWTAKGKNVFLGG